MEEQNKNVSNDAQLSEDQLKEVAGGKNIQQRRLEHLDNQTKSVDDIQETRLEHLDSQTK
ncbi:MAG: hypothetical protein AAFP20_22100 [Cyanobacteria bacterium J06614_10]